MREQYPGKGYRIMLIHKPVCLMLALTEVKAVANGPKNPKSQKTDSYACVRGFLAFGIS